MYFIEHNIPKILRFQHVIIVKTAPEILDTPLFVCVVCVCLVLTVPPPLCIILSFGPPLAGPLGRLQSLGELRVREAVSEGARRLMEAGPFPSHSFLTS